MVFSGKLMKVCEYFPFSLPITKNDLFIKITLAEPHQQTFANFPSNYHFNLQASNNDAIRSSIYVQFTNSTTS